MACAALLLTGGSSRRLGHDKATLLIDGERLVDRTAWLLGQVCRPVLEVGPGHGGLPVVREDPPGTGPLAALAAGAEALAAQGYEGAAVALAVDLPFVDVALLRWLVGHPAPATVVPVVDGVPQMLCARYGVDALAAAPGLLASGARSLRSLLTVVAVHEADEAEWASAASAASFLDVDTPADVERAGIHLPG